ncbi:MAG: glycine cleavage system aminomethyltransferase GcvT [Bacilli bacterium]|nr:glycine cleavage system aminomethyltransferase GcvT [Bacilli bacterium]MBN2877127.1 glycine cleavage system aminomethyltransferase GcvT [Bacilli bacterium]
MNEVKRTCLYQAHVDLGAKMEDFAGFMMPIVYDTIKNEHLAVRQASGMFDVSHMGEFAVKGKDATKFIDHVFCNHILDKEPGSVTYGMLLYENGTIVDDLLVYKMSNEEYFLVVNASNVGKDYSWLVDQTDDFDVTVINRSEEISEIAIQGPQAEAKVKQLLGIDLSSLEFFHYGYFEYGPYNLLISRTGYTGEDGFEIYASDDAITELWSIFHVGGVVPCGLGSRDTLRFEAALPLYGHEISDTVTPLEAGFKFFTKIDSDSDFIGKQALLDQQEEGLKRRLVGIELTKLAIPRATYEVYSNDELVGFITTGYLSVSLETPIALAMINRPYNKKDTQIQVKIRNKMVPGFVRDKKFLTKNYKTKGA